MIMGTAVFVVTTLMRAAVALCIVTTTMAARRCFSPPCVSVIYIEGKKDGQYQYRNQYSVQFHVVEL